MQRQAANRTPDDKPAVRPSAVPAGFAVRFAAALYDLGLAFALAFLLFIPVTAAEHWLGSMPQWIKGLLVLIVCWAYFAGFWSRAGETTGMRPWRLLVVMADDGTFPTLAAASVRFAVMILTWLAAGFVLLSVLTGKTQNTTYASVALLPLASLLCLMLSRKRQSLHDWASGTVVLRRSAPDS